MAEFKSISDLRNNMFGQGDTDEVDGITAPREAATHSAPGQRHNNISALRDDLFGDRSFETQVQDLKDFSQ